MMSQTRREKFDKDKKARLVEYIAKGFGRTKACEKVGIVRTTFSQHYKKDDKFRAAVLDAEEMANDVIEMALYKTAINGNVTAQQVWLYNRSPNRWMDRRNAQKIAVKIGSDGFMEALEAKATEIWDRVDVSNCTIPVDPSKPKTVADPDLVD